MAVDADNSLIGGKDADTAGVESKQNILNRRIDGQNRRGITLKAEPATFAGGLGDGKCGKTRASRSV